MINQQVLFMEHFYRREISLAFVIEIYLVLLKPGYDWSESKKNDYVMNAYKFSLQTAGNSKSNRQLHSRIFWGKADIIFLFATLYVSRNFISLPFLL